MAAEQFQGRPVRSQTILGPEAITAPYYGIKDTDFCPKAHGRSGDTTDGDGSEQAAVIWATLIYSKHRGLALRTPKDFISRPQPCVTLEAGDNLSGNSIPVERSGEMNLATYGQSEPKPEFEGSCS